MANHPAVAVLILLMTLSQVGAAGFHDVMAAAYLAEHSNPSLDLAASVAVLGAPNNPTMIHFRTNSEEICV